jgi:hypothetical protein
MATWFEPDASDPLDAAALVAGCFERGAHAVLLGRDVLPAAFFELGSGVAGELVQKLVNYGLRMAAVVPDLGAQPLRFREFAREANAGHQLRFCATRDEAVEWLGGVT